MDASSEQNKAEKDYALVAKDASRPTVSWLKNEPWSRFYLKQSTKKRQKDTTYAIM